MGAARSRGSRCGPPRHPAPQDPQLHPPLPAEGAYMLGGLHTRLLRCTPGLHAAYRLPPTPQH